MINRRDSNFTTCITSDARLDELYWVGVAKKLHWIGRMKIDVRALLDDYLWNESAALELNPKNMPQIRKEEFASMCSLIQKKTVEDICNILSEHGKKVNTVGTCANREFILKQFNLWSGS